MKTFAADGFRNRFAVRGVTKPPHKENVASLEVGTSVWFENEPDNPHDPNAIKVMTWHRGEGICIGYVPRELTFYFHEMMDAVENGEMPYWNAHIGELLANKEGMGEGVIVVFWSETTIPRQKSISRKF